MNAAMSLKRRMVEQIGYIELSGVFLINGEHDFGQGQRTYADFEQIIVRSDLAILGKFTANDLQLRYERVLVSRDAL